MLGNKPDYREDGRFIKEDGEAKKLKNDPHNPKNLLKKNKTVGGGRTGDKAIGSDPLADGWKPTPWNDTGAGKGDAQRPIGIPKEVYGYRYDLATGRITKEEFDKLMEDYNTDEMG